jgi:hypothetical protein
MGAPATGFVRRLRLYTDTRTIAALSADQTIAPSYRSDKVGLC